MAGAKKHFFQFNMFKSGTPGRSIKKHKHKFNKFVIDDIAEKGHTILWLPPYHCNLNPIELVWGQVKEYVARNNKNI